MTRTRTVIAAMFLILTAALLSVPAGTGAGSGVVITPAGSYSDSEWKALAGKHAGNLQSFQRGIQGKFSGRPAKLLTTDESSIGGIGFFPNPLSYGEKPRYLGMFARVRLPASSPFPDTDTGRVLSMMDVYGKDCIYTMASELKKMNDPMIKGGALVVIYGKNGDVNSAAFDQNAEALVMYIPRDSVMRFANLEMTIQSLFQSSKQLPIFKGGAQIENLRTVILAP